MLRVKVRLTFRRAFAQPSTHTVTVVSSEQSKTPNDEQHKSLPESSTREEDKSPGEDAKTLMSRTSSRHSNISIEPEGRSIVLPLGSNLDVRVPLFQDGITTNPSSSSSQQSIVIVNNIYSGPITSVSVANSDSSPSISIINIHPVVSSLETTTATMPITAREQSCTSIGVNDSLVKQHNISDRPLNLGITTGFISGSNLYLMSSDKSSRKMVIASSDHTTCPCTVTTTNKAKLCADKFECSANSQGKIPGNDAALDDLTLPDEEYEDQSRIEDSSSSVKPLTLPTSMISTHYVLTETMSSPRTSTCLTIASPNYASYSSGQTAVKCSEDSENSSSLTHNSETNPLISVPHKKLSDETLEEVIDATISVGSSASNFIATTELNDGRKKSMTLPFHLPSPPEIATTFVAISSPFFDSSEAPSPISLSMPADGQSSSVLESNSSRGLSKVSQFFKSNNSEKKDQPRQLPPDRGKGNNGGAHDTASNDKAIKCHQYNSKHSINNYGNDCCDESPDSEDKLGPMPNIIKFTSGKYPDRLSFIEEKFMPLPTIVQNEELKYSRRFSLRDDSLSSPYLSSLNEERCRIKQGLPSFEYYKDANIDNIPRRNRSMSLQDDKYSLLKFRKMQTPFYTKLKETTRKKLKEAFTISKENERDSNSSSLEEHSDAVLSFATNTDATAGIAKNDDHAIVDVPHSSSASSEIKHVEDSKARSRQSIDTKIDLSFINELKENLPSSGESNSNSASESPRSQSKSKYASPKHCHCKDDTCAFECHSTGEFVSCHRIC